MAQEPAFPAGHWEAVASETYTSPLHPVLTGAEFYLKIDVSNDGSFRGEWGEYFCSGVSPGAFGISTFPCRFSGKGAPVSGRFGPGRQGVIDLGRLGRSGFSWAAPAVDELAIDLPKNWRGDAGAAIHIADGFTSRALVLAFRDLREVSGISEGAQFRFRCTVESFDYLYVHLEGCSIVPLRAT